MGIQEALMGLGIVVLLGALIFGASRASRHRRRDQAAADAATRRNFNSEN
jgi:predicted lipid-binding transport protein (Tim44 family)